MPTTLLLDDGDDAGEQLNPIAEFTKAHAPVAAAAPAAVPHVASAPASSTTSTSAPAAQPIGTRFTAPASGASTPHGTLRTNLRTPGVGLHGRRQTDTSTTSPTQTSYTPQHRSDPYSPADVTRLWMTFIETYRPEHLLVNAMRNAMPIQVGQDTYRVAQTEVHIGYINENLQRIHDFVRNSLGNDNVTFVPEIVNEDSPLTWNDRELIAHIIKDNPETAKFIDDLKLTLL